MRFESVGWIRFIGLFEIIRQLLIHEFDVAFYSFGIYKYSPMFYYTRTTRGATILSTLKEWCEVFNDPDIFNVIATIKTDPYSI